jgi:glycosyltransferase involved in cell wall biosynthesis
MLTFTPLVSIVIPVYNGANFLREAIDSALAQTYANCEIIVVNDGSNDDTEQIALSYGEKIRYFAKENGGTSTALNLGIEKMRGEYFSWLSHDDLYYPNKITRQVEELSTLKNKNTIIICEVDGLDENYVRTFPKAMYQEHRDAYPRRNSFWLYPVVYNKTHGCTHLIPKCVFDVVGNFDEKWLVAHDFEFYYRAFAKFPHKFIPDVLITARESSSRQGRRSHTRGNIEYSLLYITILENLSDADILQLAPNLSIFFLDMEAFFAWADYSIALDYLEVAAEGKGITTLYGRRKIYSMYNQAAEESEKTSEQPTNTIPIHPISRYNIPMRVIQALKRYGLRMTAKIIFLRVKAKIRSR